MNFLNKQSSVSSPRTRRILGFAEITVVVGIIIAVAAFILIATEEGKKNSRNTARVTQIQEYQKAFDMVYSQTGRYPHSSLGSTTPTCLGSYESKSCWHNQSIKETSLIENAIVPKYMSRLHTSEDISFGEGKSYKGIVYVPGLNAKSYKIFYFMEGNDRSCIIEKATGTNNGKDTLCILSIP